MKKNIIKPDFKFTEKEKEFYILEPEIEKEIEERIKKILDFINNNSGKGKSEKEKDELYSKSQELWKNFYNYLLDVKYNLVLNNIEISYLIEVFTKIEYDVSNIFEFVEIRDIFFGKKYNNEYNILKLTSTEISFLYHVIKTHKIKGVNDKIIIFANILKKIGLLSKIVNYYEEKVKDISTSIHDWVVSFDDNVTIEEKNKNNQ